MRGRGIGTAWMWLGLGALALDLLILADALRAMPRLAVDFEVFRRAAQAPIAELYPGDPVQPFVNPPPAIFLFRPLAWLGYWPGFAAWTAINLLVFFAGLRRLFPQGAVLAALASPVLLWAAWLGQATPLLTGLAALGMAASPLTGGLLLGFVLCIKPQMIWLLPVALAIRRDWTRLAASVGGAIALCLVSLAALGLGAWQGWLDALGEFRQAALDQFILQDSVSLSAQAQQLGPTAAALFWVAALLLAALTFGRAVRDATPPLAFAFSIGASALCAPYSLQHDIVGLLPLALLVAVGEAAIGARLLAASVFLGIFPSIAITVALFRSSALNTREDLALGWTDRNRAA